MKLTDDLLIPSGAAELPGPDIGTPEQPEIVPGIEGFTPDFLKPADPTQPVSGDVVADPVAPNSVLTPEAQTAAVEAPNPVTTLLAGSQETPALPPMQLTPEQELIRRVEADLIMSESSGNYRAMGPLMNSGSHAGTRALGLYQFMPSTLRAYGYQGKLADFIEDLPTQEYYFREKHMPSLIQYAKQNGIIDEATPPEVVAGYLWAGHLGGAGAMKSVHSKIQASGGITPDLQLFGASDGNTKTGQYFLRGMNNYLKRSGQPISELGDPTKSRKGDLISSSGDAYRAVIEGSRARVDMTFADEVELTRQSWQDSMVSGVRNAYIDAIDKAFADVNEKLKTNYSYDTLAGDNLQRYYYGGILPGSQSQWLYDTAEKYENLREEILKKDPNVKLPETESLFQQVADMFETQELNYQQKKKDLGWMSWLAGNVAGLENFMRDPNNTAALFGSIAAGTLGAVTAGGRIATASGVNMGLEVPIQMSLEELKDAGGIPYSEADKYVNILAAGAGAGIAQGIGEVAAPIAKAVREKFNPTKQMYTEEGVKQMSEALEKAAIDNTPLEVTRSMQQFNPFGDGYNANAALGRRLAKIEDDISKGLTPKAIPDGAPVPPPPATYGRIVTEYAQSILPTDPALAQRLSKSVSDLKNYATKKAEVTPKEAQEIPIPTTNTKSVPEVEAERALAEYNQRIDSVPTEPDKLVDEYMSRMSQTETTYASMPRIKNELRKIKPGLFEETAPPTPPQGVKQIKPGLFELPPEVPKVPGLDSLATRTSQALRSQIDSLNEIRGVVQKDIEINKSKGIDTKDLEGTLKSFDNHSKSIVKDQEKVDRLVSEIAKDTKKYQDTFGKYTTDEIKANPKIQQELSDELDKITKKQEELEEISKGYDDDLDLIESIEELEVSLKTETTASASFKQIKEDAEEEVSFLRSTLDCLIRGV